MKGTFMRKQTIAMAVYAVFAAAPWATVYAQTPSEAPKGAHAGHHSEAKPGDSAYAEAEVRKVDKDAGKITLKHGPIPNLDMPAMSMVFRAKDPAMLDALKAGDKIRFKADKVQGAYTLTEIQPMN